MNNEKLTWITAIAIGLFWLVPGMVLAADILDGGRETSCGFSLRLPSGGGQAAAGHLTSVGHGRKITV